MNPISADQTDQNSDADGDRKRKRRLRPGNVTQPAIVPIGRCTQCKSLGLESRGFALRAEVIIRRSDVLQ